MDDKITRADPGTSKSMSIARHPQATPAQLSVHNNFRESIRMLKKSLLRSIYYLRLIRDGKIHRRLGYSTILDYAVAEAGLSRRQCKAFLALGRRLDDLPRISADLEHGRLSWRQAEEISRIATPETERIWIEIARSVSARELERRVGAVYRKGSVSSRIEKEPAGSKRGPAVELESRSTYGDSSAAKAPVVHPPSPSPTAGSSKIPVLGPTPGSGVQIPADSHHFMTFKFTTEQYILWEAWLTEARRRDATATKEALLTRGLGAPSGEISWSLRTVIHMCPKCGSAHLPTNRGDITAPRSLIERSRCSGEIQTDDGRVKRIVPPRLQRRVHARDGHRCRADGCRHTCHLELHHIVPVACGGSTTIDNLVTLCAGCHRRLHEGEKVLTKLLNEAP